jgi:hypothetical protein
MTTSPITPGDSLVAVVAELRKLDRDGTWITKPHELASSIERASAEIQKELPELRAAHYDETDGITGTLRNDELQELRAKLAACERDAARWAEAKKCDIVDGVDEGHVDYNIAKLASRAAPDPGPIHPWDAVGVLKQPEPPRP